MAVPEVGEVPLEINGRTYILTIDFMALAAMEDALSKPGQPRVNYAEALDRLQHNELGACIAFLFAGLNYRHPDITMRGAAKLLQELGGVNALGDVFNRAAAAAFPGKVELAANPPKARRKSVRRGATSTGGPGASGSVASGSGG